MPHYSTLINTSIVIILANAILDLNYRKVSNNTTTWQNANLATQEDDPF